MPKAPTTVLFTAVAAFLGGGLAGAVFNWYVNRPQPTIVTYTISTTSLGSTEVSSVVPDLKIEVGKEIITSLYTHAVELSVAKGPFVDQVEIAITFKEDVRVFGTKTDAPSPLHAVDCTPLQNGLRCKIGPLQSGNPKPFRVVLATNKELAPQIQAANRTVQLLSNQEYITKNNESLLAKIKDHPEYVATFAVTGLYLYVLVGILPKLKRRIIPSLVVGKVVDVNGRVVSGADVEVAVIQPETRRSESICKTDAQGDFISTRSASKIALFRAKVRVRHPDYEVEEFESDSPVIVATLKPFRGQVP